MANNRELSQLGSFIIVNGINGNIGIATTATPYVGIGTTNPQAKLHVVSDAIVGELKITSAGIVTSNNPGVTTVKYYGDGSNLFGVNGSGESYWASTAAGIHTLSNVGVGTTNPNATVTFANTSTLAAGIVSSYTFNTNLIGVADTSYSNSNNFIIETKTITTATTSQVGIDTFSAELYRSAKYYAQLTNDSDYHVVEITVLHDGSSVYLLESNAITLNSVCGIFTGSISGSNLILSLTPSSSEPTNIILNRTLIRSTGTAFAPTGDLQIQSGSIDFMVGTGQYDLNT